MSFAFIPLRGLDIKTTFAQSRSYQSQMGLIVSKALWSVPIKDIQAPKANHTGWEESVFSASTRTESSLYLY